jgi:hypothetical protein
MVPVVPDPVLRATSTIWRQAAPVTGAKGRATPIGPRRGCSDRAVPLGRLLRQHDRIGKYVRWPRRGGGDAGGGSTAARNRMARQR